ncbi:hypothetical protein [Sphingomonas sp. DT-204]|uniref:hypothetical protein n=1 Tax=Sphingomonas sp. DT-204 TaxID=3396166 RepID=UPI003F1BF4CB
MNVRSLTALSVLALFAAGCSNRGEIDPSGGITAVRTACPSVGVPAATGDVTLFNPETARTADAIDVVASITNVRSTCNDTVDPIYTSITFDVQARRTRTDAARDVTLPFYSAVVQGGTVVTAKRVSQVTVHFEAGQERATASGTAGAYVDRAAATLPPEVRNQITRRRKAGQQEAAMDPLANPAVRQAVLRATFEALVGFQLTDDQLKYNATR